MSEPGPRWAGSFGRKLRRRRPLPQSRPIAPDAQALTVTDGHMPTFAQSLRPEVLKDFEARGQRVAFSKGERLISDRAPGRRVLLLEDGYVKISRVTRGREAVLDFRGPGELLGEQAALREGLRTAAVEALTDGQAVSMPGATFVDWVTARPDTSLAVMRVLSNRLSDADAQRLEYGASQTLGRVAARLLTLAGRFGRQEDARVEIGLAISQEELAAWSGSSREATVKALRALRDLGVVETSRRRLVVGGVERLARHAG